MPKNGSRTEMAGSWPALLRGCVLLLPVGAELAYQFSSVPIRRFFRTNARYGLLAASFTNFSGKVDNSTGPTSLARPFLCVKNGFILTADHALTFLGGWAVESAGGTYHVVFALACNDIKGWVCSASNARFATHVVEWSSQWALFAVEAFFVPIRGLRRAEADFPVKSWGLTLPGCCIIDLVSVARLYLLAFACLIIPELIGFAVMPTLQASLRYCVPSGVDRADLALWGGIVVVRSLLRALGADKFFLVPEWGIRRAESLSGAAWSWCRGGCASWLRGLTSFASDAVNHACWTFDGVVVGLAVATESKTIPYLIFSARAAVPNIDIIERMLLRTNLAT